jgi:hypothetical protein
MRRMPPDSRRSSPNSERTNLVDSGFHKQGPARNAALNITTNVSPTLVNEFIFGPSQNNLTLDPQKGAGREATYSGIGLSFQPPYPYNPNQFINLNFSGTPNQTYGVIHNYSQFPYKNSNTTFDFIDNLSKVWGKHVLKFGMFVQRSRKDPFFSSKDSVPSLARLWLADRFQVGEVFGPAQRLLVSDEGSLSDEENLARSEMVRYAIFPCLGERECREVGHEIDATRWYADLKF